jgi:hypothetical protein
MREILHHSWVDGIFIDAVVLDDVVSRQVEFQLDPVYRVAFLDRVLRELLDQTLACLQFGVLAEVFIGKLVM